MKPIKLKALEISKSRDIQSTKPSTDTSKLSVKSNSKKKLSKLSIDTSQYVKIPKNVNDYRHIIDYIYTKASDFEWILDLRNYKPINHIESSIAPVGPSCYDTGLELYKKRNTYGENKRYLKTNIAQYSHIIDNPAGMPANQCILSYETSIRNDEEKKGYPKWKSTICSSKKNLFDCYLPPILKQSKDNIDKLGDMVARPLQQVNTEVMLNGEKVRQRKFVMGNENTLRFPCEHLPSSKYNNKFKIKNIGAIKDILNYDNINATALWSAGLREYDKYHVAKTESNNRKK